MRATTTGRQRLFISYGRPRDDSKRRPAPSRKSGASTTDNCLRSLIARVVGHRNDEAHDRCREHRKQTTRGEHVYYVGTWSWSQSAVCVSRTSKRGRDDNICVSCAESKGGKLPLKSRPCYGLSLLTPWQVGEAVPLDASRDDWHRERSKTRSRRTAWCGRDVKKS